MERLTERELDAYGDACYCKCHSGDCDYECDECDIISEGANRLKAYEDSEEQGVLIRLPLAKGDAFWEINRGTTPASCYKRYAHLLSHCVYVLERLGKTCFLTMEEAKAALERMNGDA